MADAAECLSDANADSLQRPKKRKNGSSKAPNATTRRKMLRLHFYAWTVVARLANANPNPNPVARPGATVPFEDLTRCRRFRPGDRRRCINLGPCVRARASGSELEAAAEAQIGQVGKEPPSMVLLLVESPIVRWLVFFCFCFCFYRLVIFSSDFLMLQRCDGRQC